MKNDVGDMMLEKLGTMAQSKSGNYCRTNEDYTEICSYHDKRVICPCRY